MSIATRTGDDGTTGLMYNRRVAKSDPRVEAYGTVDEFNAALGFARATASDPSLAEGLITLQRQLVVLMGELATLPADRDRYVADGFQLVTPEMTAGVDVLVARLEAAQPSFKGWATPGATLHAAALDLARTVCRRAERRIEQLRQAGGLPNEEILVFLNRVSDLLWLMARTEESAHAGAAEMPKVKI